jgi:adenylosuccinate synthase
VEPIYEELPGWAEEIDRCNRFDQLPLNAQRYVRRLEELLAVPVGLVSVGRRREQTILLAKRILDAPSPGVSARAVSTRG